MPPSPISVFRFGSFSFVWSARGAQDCFISSPMARNTKSWALFMSRESHSMSSYASCETLDGAICFGGGWGICGEGSRITVPLLSVILSKKRKDAEVDCRRLGGANSCASFSCTNIRSCMTASWDVDLPRNGCFRIWRENVKELGGNLSVRLLRMLGLGKSQGVQPLS